MPVQILTGTRKKPRPQRPTSKLHNTTVRDFGGGLNSVDSELNLTSKFSPVFDNMVTYTDKRVGPRWGYELWLKTKQGTHLQSGTNKTVNVLTALDSQTVNIVWTAHPFTLPPPPVGEPDTEPLQHVTFSGITGGPFNGIPASDLNQMHGIDIVNANEFRITVRTKATASSTITGVVIPNWTSDDHMCGGTPVEAFYFSNHIIVWTSIGEIFAINSNKAATRLWSTKLAFPQANDPGWGKTDIIAKDVFGHELISCNGVDKPVAIDLSRAGPPTEPYAYYLIDKDSTVLSNAFIPVFNACKSAFRYFTVHDSVEAQYKTHIRIGAKDSAQVWTSTTPEPPIDDSVDVDVSNITASVEQTVRAFATIKDALLVIMPSATVLMKYGFLDGNDNHDPQPIDVLSGFGTSAMRSVVEIGSDVFMLDYNGVPSARLSTVSNAIVPERVSQYIETMISRHIGRIQMSTTRLKLFGFFDSKNRRVHFYLPKYDDNDVRELARDPFYYDSDMSEAGQPQLVVRIDKHQLEVGDVVRITDADGFGVLLPEDINGDRTVAGILSDDYILINTNKDLPNGSNEGGGGNNVKLQPLNNETIGYTYHFVPALKMQSWSRFKLMKVTCGCASIQGRSFLFDADGNMLRYGSPDQPVYGDWANYYDFLKWTSGQAYTTGQRVFDGSDGLVYKCLANVTRTAATFYDARLADPDSWEQYRGEPVKFAWELPWADFGSRQLVKALRFFHADAEGNAQFDVELFTDKIYRDTATGVLIPARKLTFVPNDAFAFGAGIQTYGGGRRTREQRLWAMPMKFKLMKVRISGGTVAPLSFSALSFLYQRGSAVRG